MKLGYIGLGKMGKNMVYRLKEKSWDVVAYNRSPEPRREVARRGVKTADSIQELVNKLSAPRTVWVMVTHGAVEAILNELCKYLKKGDTIIEGGNSFFELTQKRARRAEKIGIHFLDVGVSGGPSGARHGACLMIGGRHEIFKKHESLFRDIAAENSYGHMGEAGAGHFVKMVHNGIEYGMMQAVGEGFSVLKKSKFRLDLEKVADLYNHGSVIESRLVGWLKDAYRKYGEDLKEISGKIAHSGEGGWTVKTAKKLKVPTPIIKSAFTFRVQSQKKPSYIGQVVSVLRNMFGGHEVKK